MKGFSFLCAGLKRLTVLINRDFYNIRLQKLREKAIAKRNMERLKNPASFPSVPKGGPV